MKKINLLLMSLSALLMACFTACENQYEVDHTAELVGTWTYIRANYAEALVFNADGKLVTNQNHKKIYKRGDIFIETNNNALFIISSLYSFNNNSQVLAKSSMLLSLA